MNEKRTGRWIMTALLAMLLVVMMSSFAMAAVKPNKVTGLTATKGNKQVTLSWKAVTNVKFRYYYIYMKKGSGTYSVVQKVRRGTTSTTVSGLKNGTKYSFYVCAVRFVGTQVLYSNKSAVVTATPNIARPKKVTLYVTKVSGNRVYLSWTESSLATSYEIYQKSGNGSLKLVGTTTKTGAVIKGLKNNYQYTFAVRSRRDVGKDTAYSRMSNRVTARPSKNATVTTNVVPMQYRGRMRYSYGALKAGTYVTVTFRSNWKCNITANGYSYSGVPNSYVTLLSFIYNNKTVYSQQVAQAFVNSYGYSSSSNYLIWVSVGTQHVYLFKGSKYHWILQGSPWLCNTGKLSNAIGSGLYAIGHKKGGTYGYLYSGSVFAYYATSYSGENYFHSILFNRSNGSVVGQRLGVPASLGCIRMPVDKAKFFWTSIPAGTRVVMY